MKVEKKKKQKFTTLDRLVMKIFRERSRTSRRGTCSFSSITAAALQNAHRVPAFSSSLFQLSLLLSLFRLLSQNPFLPASSICLGPRFYFYTRRCYHPPTRYSFHFPPPSTSQLPYPPLPLSLSPPPPIPPAFRLSRAASPHPTPLCLLSSFCSLSLTRSLLLLLRSVPDLFYSRDGDCSLHILRGQPRSVCSSLSIYPSMLYSSVRQLNPSRFSSHRQDFALRASPLPRALCRD